MNDMKVRFIVTLVIAVIAGWLFTILNIFLPWLLGPLMVMIILKNTVSYEFVWPDILRSIGLVIIGIQMGTSFTAEAVKLMGLNLPLMLVLTLLVTGFATVCAWFLARLTGYSFETAVLGGFPGGLSQMVLLSEEIKGADVSAVAFMQTIRILMVITVVPFLATYFFPGGLSSQVDSTVTVIPQIRDLIILGAGITLLILIMKKLHFPIPFMLGPLLAVTLFNVFIGNEFLVLDPLVAAAQVMLGTHLGLQMTGLRKLISVKPLAYVVMINLLLITFCIFLAWVMNQLFSFTLIDTFLSAAPGGVAEMAITAYEVGADVSTVTSFHLFRIFFILFAAAPLTVYLLKRRKVV
ncbi:AbrB family transcriptional regulator [Jeotgalibacillus sp. R-1-5s-1]|uniref:AbrB family transcriptional regulator n=1 Tax=Jeotgalibacillus sp. R-1-5s-1 TaxID=2555897 RepID=UPI00106BA759|nr:AbrB family transcriptional regulator [Jeotgalibacillus sp. R-1-5s-1]TFD92433.1 AbrB family transcriptional regulator [Jeotgalibacillus sp. R-1-5s-1]